MDLKKYFEFDMREYLQKRFSEMNPLTEEQIQQLDKNIEEFQKDHPGLTPRSRTSYFGNQINVGDRILHLLFSTADDTPLEPAIDKDEFKLPRIKIKIDKFIDSEIEKILESFVVDPYNLPKGDNIYGKFVLKSDVYEKDVFKHIKNIIENREEIKETIEKDEAHETCLGGIEK